MRKQSKKPEKSNYRWYYSIINCIIMMFAMIPFRLLLCFKKRFSKISSFHHLIQCSTTYKYYHEVCQHCKREGAVFYIAEAPEISKIYGLSEEQIEILNKNMTTSELLNDKEYLIKAYCGNENCLAFANNRYKGTKLYYNGKYVRPEDCTSIYYNVKNGIRYTPANNGNGKYTIHMFGSCIVRGYGVSDEYTIPNYLQEMINKKYPGLANVINHGTGGATGYDGIINDLSYILDTSFQKGDIVVFITYHTYLEYLIKAHQKERYFECSQLFSNRKIEKWWFLNSVVHLNQVGNQVIAEKLCEIITSFLLENELKRENEYTRENETPVSKNKKKSQSFSKCIPPEEKEALLQYISFLKSVKAECHGNKIGAIVMNCNPFTLGHKYLVESAAMKVEHLYIFVVEEDSSYFRYKDRFHMVQKGTEEIPNVTVLPSGKFVISALTFPEYFQKEENQEIVIDATNDLELFGAYIAPALGITVRFAGSEPFDAVTNQYNHLMNSMLGKYGIEFRCLERYKLEGEYISATKVRKLIKDGNLEEVGKFVPKSTMEIIKREYFF